MDTLPIIMGKYVCADMFHKTNQNAQDPIESPHSSAFPPQAFSTTLKFMNKKKQARRTNIFSHI